MAQECFYRNLVAPAINDSHKTHIFSLTKLASTAGEFCGKIASLKESSANHMLSLVDTYRKKTVEIRKRPEYQSLSFYSAWDHILNEVEQEAKELIELAGLLQNTVAATLSNEAGRKKGLIKKVFSYRDYFQNKLNKSEDSVSKKHKDYTDAWMKYRVLDKDTAKDHRHALYYNSHNAYLWKLTEFNARNEVTYEKLFPEILDDLENLQGELANSFAKYLARFGEVQLDFQSNKLNPHLQNIVNFAGTVNSENDINVLVNSIEDELKSYTTQTKEFTAPKLTKENKETKVLEVRDQSKLKGELLLNEFTEPVLKRQCAFTRRRITKLESSGTMDEKAFQRPKPSNDLPQQVTNSLRKVSEALIKRNDAREKHSILACLNRQIALYSPAIMDKLGPVSEEYADDLEELKEDELENENAKKLKLLSMRPDKEKAHRFLEQNFLKPAQCYYCKGIIIGILKQGCRCANCRMAVHKRCRGNVPFCTGGTLPKDTHFEATDMDSSTGDYEAIDGDSDHSTPPKPVSKGPYLGKSQEKDKKPTADDTYFLYSPPIPQHGTARDNEKEHPTECVALFDFECRESVDLEIKAGDRIKILTTPSEDWWEGQIGNKKGYFPTSYVQVITPGDTILRCIYDFGSEEGDEMCIEEGQIIILVNEEGNGWMVGKSGDKVGAFPASYVEVIK